jgi:hypothetical protein
MSKYRLSSFDVSAENDADNRLWENTRASVQAFMQELDELVSKHNVVFPEQEKTELSSTLLKHTFRDKIVSNSNNKSVVKIHKASVLEVAEECLAGYAYFRISLRRFITKLEERDQLQPGTLLHNKKMVKRIRETLETLHHKCAMEEEDLNPHEAKELSLSLIEMNKTNAEAKKTKKKFDLSEFVFGLNFTPKSGNVPFARPSPTKAADIISTPMTWSQFTTSFIENAKMEKQKFTAQHMIKHEKAPPKSKTCEERQKFAARSLGFFGTEQYVQVRAFVLMLWKHFQEEKTASLAAFGVTEEMRAELIEITNEVFATYTRAWNEEHKRTDSCLIRQDDKDAEEYREIIMKIKSEYVDEQVAETNAPQETLANVTPTDEDAEAGPSQKRQRPEDQMQATKQPAFARIPRLSDKNVRGAACTPKK